MRDLAFLVFLAALFLFGLKRPFVFVLGYAYIDIVAPQLLCYYLLGRVPISLIFFCGAVGAWLLADDKRDVRISGRQLGLALLLLWAGTTTLRADFPVDALNKWAWVWKSMVFAIFLPFTLRTRLRVEALILFMILSGGSIIITGGIKTLFSGGGYGVLNLGVDNNTGLYEGSIISAFAIAIIPLILYLMRYDTIFGEHRLKRTFGCALIFACLLIPIGTEARTGLVCVGVLAVLFLRTAKRRLLYVSVFAAVSIAALPFLPASFTSRMGTIESYDGDESASTRIQVWKWTLDYVGQHPLGGGFDAYRQNAFTYQTVAVDQASGKVDRVTVTDKARAYHSAYFEMLGEQGWPGFLLWLGLHGYGLLRMEVLRRRHLKAPTADGWIAPLAQALQSAHIVYLVSALFVGIAFQSFAYMWIACEIGLDAICRRKRAVEAGAPFGPRAPTPAVAA